MLFFWKKIIKLSKEEKRIFAWKRENIIIL